MYRQQLQYILSFYHDTSHIHNNYKAFTSSGTHSEAQHNQHFGMYTPKSSLLHIIIIVTNNRHHLGNDLGSSNIFYTIQKNIHSVRYVQSWKKEGKGEKEGEDGEEGEKNNWFNWNQNGTRWNKNNRQYNTVARFSLTCL